MKLLIVTSRFPPQVGGAATVFGLLGDGLSKNINVSIITNSNTSFLKTRKLHKFKVHELFPYFTGIMRVFLIPLTFFISFLFFLENYRDVDVIETHTVGEICLFFQIFALLFRKPLVKHVLDTQTPGFLLKHPMSKFICCGESLKQRICSHGIPKYYVTSINLPIQNFKCKKKVSGKRIFLFIGEIAQHKGVKDVLTVLKKINRKDFEVWFVGDGPLVKLLNNDSRIKYLGKMSHDDIIELYRKSDILIHPTYRDVMPLTILDAMMMKNTIISTDIGEIKETVGNGGIIINSGELNNLKKAMTYMIDNDLTKLKSNAYKNYLKYSKQDVINANLKVCLSD